MRDLPNVFFFFFKQMKKKEKTNCKKKKSQLKARELNSLCSADFGSRWHFLRYTCGEIKWANERIFEDDMVIFWRSHVPVETFWVLGWGDFAGWFYTNKRSLWNHINWILLSVGVGNTTESNCTIVGLKLYRRDFMQWWIHRENGDRARKINIYDDEAKLWLCLCIFTSLIKERRSR